MNVTRNTLPLPTRKTAVALLNNPVADLFDLYARTKQAHWNLRGDSFLALHLRLDTFAATISELIDAAAERATALGGIVEGTLRDAVKLANPFGPRISVLKVASAPEDQSTKTNRKHRKYEQTNTSNQ